MINASYFGKVTTVSKALANVIDTYKFPYLKCLFNSNQIEGEFMPLPPKVEKFL